MRAIDKLSEIREIELNYEVKDKHREESEITNEDVKDICQLLSDKQLFRFSLSLAKNK